MLRLAPISLALVLALLCCAPACASAAAAARSRPGASAGASGRSSAAAGATARASSLSPSQQRYLLLAQAAVRSAQARWGDRARGWYDARLNDRERYPLATIWDIVPLFEALDAIAIAQPTAADRAAVARFAAGAERYLNRGLRPLPGFSPYPGDREANTQTWFDDNGWWGLAFVNAYRATGTRRYLADAMRALSYISSAGWDARAGGVWWNTGHPYKAGEALASAALLASLLYRETRSSFALAQAHRLLDWADGAGFSPADGLYAGSSLDPTPIDYIEAPLIYAHTVLCEASGTPAECERAELLKARAVERFGQMLDFSPQYDAIYLQWMLALYGADHDPGLYRMAADNAHAAETRARGGGGLYLLAWAGHPLPARYARPGMLQTQGATASLFAWLAVYQPPA